MLVHTIPKDGYESVATCNLDFLGFGEDWKPDGSPGDKFMALESVYAILDGMNEKGLCVADLMVSHETGLDQDTEKPDLTITSVLRLLSLSDTTCRSVAVEWINGEMVVTDTLTGDEIQEY